MRPAFFLRPLGRCLVLAGIVAAVAASSAHAQTPAKPEAAKADLSKLDKVSFGTNWIAEAEHGGDRKSVV